MPAEVQPLEKILNRMLGMEQSRVPESLEEQLDEIDFSKDFMVVVSNKRKLFGAAALLYPGLLQEICRRAKKDLICLPSSIHETILVPDNGKTPIREFQKMVHEINAAEVKETDRLSDSVYRISCVSGEISIC